VAATTVLMLFAAIEAVVVFQASFVHADVTIGMDYRLYTERATSWLAGPHTIAYGDALYSPSVLVLLVPFTFLPAVLSWAIPAAIVAAAIWRNRPPAWTRPILAGILVYPRTWAILVYGNPSMWALAGIAAGCAWGWPAAAALVKPTLAPFGLIGIRQRFWWPLALLPVILFAQMWPIYLTALLNALTHSVPSIWPASGR
jgi:hypothetical protein